MGGERLFTMFGRDGDEWVGSFDAATGVEAWRSLSDMAGYAAPVTVEVGGIRQALFFTAEGLVSVAPAPGDFYWRVPWRTTFDVNAAAPVVVPPDMVFISSATAR